MSQPQSLSQFRRQPAWSNHYSYSLLNLAVLRWQDYCFVHIYKFIVIFQQGSGWICFKPKYSSACTLNPYESGVIQFCFEQQTYQCLIILLCLYMPYSLAEVHGNLRSLGEDNFLPMFNCLTWSWTKVSTLIEKWLFKHHFPATIATSMLWLRMPLKILWVYLRHVMTNIHVIKPLIP